MADGDQSPGWDAITRAAEQRYGDQEPRHWGTLIKWALGGPDPLDGVSCWEAGDHWHYVSYGLSELYEKSSSVAEESGFGFELTFRLRRRQGQSAPPTWPATLMQDLARYVFRTGNVLRSGEHIDCHRAIGEDEEAAVRALAFTADPELGSIDTPHGRVRFVQMVGVTLDELDAIKSWRTEGVLGLLARDNPLLVTDPSRGSILEQPGVKEEIDRGIAESGSSMGASYVDELDWTRDDEGNVRISLGAIAVPDVRRALRGRIPFQRPYRLQGPEKVVAFWPAGTEESAEEADANVLFVELTPALAATLHEGLAQRAGTYAWPEVDGLTIEVTPTEIRDDSGEIVDVVG